METLARKMERTISWVVRKSIMRYLQQGGFR